MSGTELPHRSGTEERKKSVEPIVGSPNRGPLNWRGGEKKFEGLLEIKFLHPSSKYRDGNPFSHSAEID